MSAAMITGLDGKEYPRTPGENVRLSIIGRVHQLSHDGLSVRDISSKLMSEGTPRSTGSISGDLKKYRCEKCSGAASVPPERATEEKDMHGDGELVDGDEVVSEALTADEVDTMRSTALAEGTMTRATAAPREADPTFVNWKWAVLADLLKRQTTDDLNSDEPTIHEEAFYEVLEFIARNYDPHPNDQFEQGGSIIEGIYNLVSGYLVGDLWHKPEVGRG